ncbi:DUF3596 domain-containing protein [Providencia alcalifaciens]|uniref:tyrosine-type recombinase/integrase n=1 Tax=Providencia alcalifaciens TaxID=126385 RepID=UPI0012B61620|nr:site-specific integrase [Providencia alcalifaciens]MTC32425.1 DUF3596 domain-containing protein [Providencia alcalifaciens]
MKIKYPTGVEVHGKSLRISFTYKGKRVRETLGIPDTPKNRKLAGELRTAICYKIKTGAFDYSVEFPESKNCDEKSISNKNVTFGYVANKWVELKRIEVAVSTFEAYKSIVNVLFFFIDKNKMINLFNLEDILSVRNKMLTSPTIEPVNRVSKIGRSVSTVNNYMKILNCIFCFAAENKYIETNILSSIKNLKKSRAVPDPITKEEFPRLLNATRNIQAKNMLIVSVYTGLRPGELCALAYEDIDFIERTITVKRNISNIGDFSLPKTPSSTDRIIHMLDPVYESLREQMSLTRMTSPEIVNVEMREYGKYREDSCTFVFQPSVVARNGLETKHYSPGGFNGIWGALIKRSGVRHRKSYQTRHTYACWMLSAGANPAFIATQMGHSSAKMIYDVYGAWMKENDKDQIAIMNRNAPHMPQPIERKVINS